MAQQLKNITLGAPGFYGLNTELSPVELPPQFCTTANNCVIDHYGRLGARKGFNTQSDVITGLGGEKVKRIFEWSSSGTSILFAVGNSKIFRLDTTSTPHDTLTEMTLPGGYSITGDNWDFADFNGECFFFQADHAPLLCNTVLNGTDSLDTLDSQSSETVPDAPEGDIVLAATARLWVAGVSTAKSTVYWSDTLIADGFTEGASGSIDLATVWPNGYDEITGLASQNGRLVIFGKNSVVIYSTPGNSIDTAAPDSPATMTLEDTIAGTGCVARDSIQHTGDDVLYLSPTGLRSLGRTVEQSSLPLGDLTGNVRTDLINDINSEAVGINSVYSHEENFYLLTLEGQEYTYCIDFKGELDNGIRRVTVWPGSPFNCAMRADDGTLYVGGLLGTGTYSGYMDGASSYRYQYYSPSLTFETQANLKFLKKVRPILIGAAGNVATVSWGYGYTNVYTSETVAIEGGGALAEYSLSEYDIAEYSTPISVSDRAVNTNGSGEEVSLGVGIDINGSAFSLQQINVYALIGRLV